MNDDSSDTIDPRAARRAQHAESYARAGDPLAAAEIMRQALELAPDWTLGRVRLAAFEEAAGEREAAVATLAASLADDPDGRFGAGLKLAALGAAPVPQAAPPAFVEGLFDQYAERFEHSLVERLGYRIPDILREELVAMGAAGPFGAVLDLGCGTGLMGERLRPMARRLDGLDISGAMLRKARAKRIYDSLTAGNLLDTALESLAAYDLVTAADVLIYVGDLRPVFASVARRLKAGGLFAFSIETHEGEEPFVLRPSLRYAHAAGSLAGLLAGEGLALARSRPCTVRKDGGADIAGLAVMAALRP
ncbi:class I SAM-dependent DNA methyltransferase [Aureimonas populi]|uniref:Class I SAM-dependent DNA methyltransferase n=1 Tax=Aureimonas populi TaxID=1701758 RepID=A0ABW5CFV1_9HYPH|nr:methyltransferase [Aureimonas populi]